MVPNPVVLPIDMLVKDAARLLLENDISGVRGACLLSPCAP